MQLTRSELAN